MKPTSRNSIPRVFFRFAPMWKGEKTRFELNWTIIDNNGFLPCLEKTTQDGGMKPTSWNSIPRVFFRFPRWGKSNIRIFNAIGRPSSTRLFALLLKAHPKWWYETDRVEFDPKRVFFVSPRWGKSKKRVFTAIGRPSSIWLFALLGKAHPKWRYETDLVEFDPKRIFSFNRDGESRKTRFERNWTTFVNPAFCAAWKSPPKMVV